MPIDVFERPKSRGYIDDPAARRVTREYWARGSEVDEDIKTAVLLTAPTSIYGLTRRIPSLREEGPSFWYCNLDYLPEDGETVDGSDEASPGELSPPITESDHLAGDFGFSTTGGTQHITQSLNTIDSFGAVTAVGPPPVAADVPDTQQAIGVTKDSVEGCDVFVPKLEFSITKRISFITMKDIQRWSDATGKKNEIEWNTFQAGEVLFLGCEGKYQGDNNTDESWLVTFKFAISKNREGILIREGDATGLGRLVVSTKKGWDYIWVGFVEEKDATANKLVQRPKYAYVEEVYDDADFREELGF